jgi:hypothetical protein
MKKPSHIQTTIALIVLLGSFSFLSCSKENQPDPVGLFDMDTISFEHSMKGWELYSWPNGNDWNYSLLPGTNRTKSYEEVIHNNILVCGIDSLKMLIDKFPVNEEIGWIGEEWLTACWGYDYGELTLPGKKIRDEIQAYCDQKELKLSIID